MKIGTVWLVICVAGLVLFARVGAQVPAAERPGGDHAPQATGTTPTADDPSAVPKDVTPPKLMHSVDPKFPRQERHDPFSGATEVKLVVGADGMPSQVEVVRSCGRSELDKSAVKAVLQYRFTPALKAGQPVPVNLYVDVHFEVR